MDLFTSFRQLSKMPSSVSLENASIAGDEDHKHPSWVVFDVCASGDDRTIQCGCRGVCHSWGSVRSCCGGATCHLTFHWRHFLFASVVCLSSATAAPLVMRLNQEVLSKAVCSQEAESISGALEKP